MLEKNANSLQKLVKEFLLSDSQKRQFVKYIDLLEVWSRRTNLVSTKRLDEVVSKHISDSLELVRWKLVDDFKSVLDLGSGAGFPGVPLSIVYPQIKFWLLDSRKKRALFLEEVKDVVGLRNVTVLWKRAEDVRPEEIPRVECVVSRAVADLRQLWKWSKPLLTDGGLLIAIKGREVNSEIEQLGAARVRKVIPCEHPAESKTKIVIIS